MQSTRGVREKMTTRRRGTRSQDAAEGTAHGHGDDEKNKEPTMSEQPQHHVNVSMTERVAKENVENEAQRRRHHDDFQPPSNVLASTPAESASAAAAAGTKQHQLQATRTAETSRSTSSLFSPPPSSGSRQRTVSSDPTGQMARQLHSGQVPTHWQHHQQQQLQEGFKAAAQGVMNHHQDSSTYATYPAAASAPYSNPQQQNSNSRMQQGGRVQQHHRSITMEPRDLRDIGSTTALDDDFPAVADCLNLGSFAEESPPRSSKAFPYRNSPPPQTFPIAAAYGYPQGGQQPPLSSPYHHGFPPYQYYDQPPQPFPDMMSAPDHHHHQVPPPWASPDLTSYGQPQQQQPRQSPPPKKRRGAAWDHRDTSGSSSPDDAAATTPEKAYSIKKRSPFHSPPPRDGSTKKYKRSPLFQGGTPRIGTYGSWDTPGGGTPGGTLGAAFDNEFSPMGPSFAPFGDDDDSPVEDAVFEPKLPMEEAPPSAARPIIFARPQGQPSASPFSSFVGELSPFPARQGSPTQQHQEYASSRHGGYHHQHQHRPPEDYQRSQQQQQQQQQASMRPQSASKRKSAPPPMFASPVMPNHPGAHQPRQIPWYEHVGPSPGPFRLELGETQAGKTRKGFEDINSILRGSGSSGQPKQHQRGSPSAQQARFEPAERPRSKLQSLQNPTVASPVKLDVGPPQQGGFGSGASSRTPGFVGPTRKQTPTASATPRFTTGQKSQATPIPLRGSGGKDIVTPVSKQARRSPCNCKKSKCLKLYCECFAGELYCNGCNCADCHNTMQYDSERSKAIKDTRAKNPHAFKPRFTGKTGVVETGSPPAGHNMGCRCKRSECLKKYCECFQAGVMCGNKCKCKDCLNYVGSQALIDKRRKMKDLKGAEFAMRIADEAWKGGSKNSRVVNPGGVPQPSPPSHRGPQPMTMASHALQPSPMQANPSPRQTGPMPHYMGAMMGYPHMAYSAMGLPTVNPGFLRGAQQVMPSVFRQPDAPPPQHQQQSAAAYPGMDPRQQQSTPMLATPKTPRARSSYDPHSSKKKRKLRPGAEEPALSFFGKNPEQPKTTALAVFSYLSNDDLFHSGLVCKQWSQLATDEELWQF